MTKDEKEKVKEILKQFDDGLIITSKIDNYLSEAEVFGKDLVNIISRQVK